MGRPLSRSKLSTDGLEGGGLLVIAIQVTQKAAQPVESGRIESSVLIETVARAVAELLEVPTRLGYADHRHIEVTSPCHRVQRREDLLISQIARGAEKDESVGAGFVHGES